MILALLLFFFNNLVLSCSQKNACPVFLTENALSKVKKIKNDKKFQAFLTETLQQKNAVLRDKAFQNFITDLQTQVPLQAMSPNKLGDPSGLAPKSLPRSPIESGNMLYIFVSFSLGEKALLNLAHDAKQWGATLVLRGFREGSYVKTAQALQNIILKTGQGFIIDPELFTFFSISVVPTYVLTKPFSSSAFERIQTPLHDRLQGYVSVQYVLETFAKEGVLKTEAHLFLEKGGAK